MKMDHTLAEPMRAYLLSLLSDDEATALEEAYFTDRVIFLKIQAEERILIEEYLEERLRPEEKRAFESRYLKVPELQRKVEEVRQLRYTLRPAAKTVRVYAPMLRPLAMVAMFAMVLALGIGVLAVYHGQKKDVQSLTQVQPQRISPELPRPQVAAPTLPETYSPSHHGNVETKTLHSSVPKQNQMQKSQNNNRDSLSGHAPTQFNRHDAPGSSALEQRIQKQLQKQYALANVISGCSVSNPDTALIVQRAGAGMRVLSSDSTAVAVSCTNLFLDGQLNPLGIIGCYGVGPGNIRRFAAIPRAGGVYAANAPNLNNHARSQMSLMKTGDTIYPTKLEVNEGKGEIKVSIIACQQSDNPQTPYKGEIIFRFPTDIIGTENVGAIKDAIAQVFAPIDEDQQPQNREGNQQPTNSAQHSSQTFACKIEIGQTIAQVVNLCGQPVNQSKGATKVLYFYDQPKMTVVFVNGTVSDIE